MITTIKSLAILGTIAAAAFAAQPAKADHVSVGLGITIVPARTYYAAPVYVAPAPVTYYNYPTYTTTSYSYAAPTYYTPTYDYYAPAYYPPTPVVYSAPTYYYPSTSYYYSPAPVYYSRPYLNLGLGFSFGGHDRDRDRGPGPRGGPGPRR